MEREWHIIYGDRGYAYEWERQQELEARTRLEPQKKVFFFFSPPFGQQLFLTPSPLPSQHHVTAKKGPRRQQEARGRGGEGDE